MIDKINRLLQKKQYKQLSNEWFVVRKNMITASSAASLLIRDRGTCEAYVEEFGLQDSFVYDNKCCNPYSSKKSYIDDKCSNISKFKGNTATYWGQKYEQVISDIYSILHNKEILEFGLITHDIYPWLGASPDGITSDGIMVEIKCPYRRKITGIPPLYYWIQVQLQLEVCDLDECDFVEVDFMEFCTEEEFLDTDNLDHTFHHSGVLLVYSETGHDSPENFKYVYPPKETIDNTQASIQWIDEKNSDNNYSVLYWKVKEKSIVRIKRNKQWFEYVAPILTKETLYIEYLKRTKANEELE